MRVTVIREDGFISVDGEGYHGIDLTSMGSTWAIQWYETWGEVEDNNPTTPNVRIEDISIIQPYLDKFDIRKAELVAEAAAELLVAQVAWDALSPEDQAKAGPRP